MRRERLLEINNYSEEKHDQETISKSATTY